MSENPLTAPNSADGNSDDNIAAGCLQAVLGLVLGGMTWMLLMAIDPFKVTEFQVPPNADSAEVSAAFDRWRNSLRVIVGGFAMNLIPLWVSAACGAFIRRSLPLSVAKTLLRTTLVAFVLSMVLLLGMEAINRALNAGKSSDIDTPLAKLAFLALCLFLAGLGGRDACQSLRRDGGAPGASRVRGS